ncbi:hypothetical protein D3C87_1790210 [compost metagenome]
MVAFPDVAVGTHDDDTHVVGFQVERITHNAGGELQKLAGHYILQAMGPGNAVTDLHYSANFGDFHIRLILLDLIFDQYADFIWLAAQLPSPLS